MGWSIEFNWRKHFHKEISEDQCLTVEKKRRFSVTMEIEKLFRSLILVILK